MCTAAYLLNRCPTQSLDYKTLYKAATGTKPLVLHLFKVGSRAYTLKLGNYKPPARQKLATRVHLGYLLGFDSTNIYRIWIPSLNRVVRTRDVVFDKTKRFNQQTSLDIRYIVRDDLQQSLDINFQSSELANS